MYKDFFSQKIIFLSGSFLIALLLFLFLVHLEKNNFYKASVVDNPFERAVDINSSVRVDLYEDHQEFFTHDGELFLFFSGSEADFSDGKRDFLSGDLFWSSALIADRIFKESHNIAFSETFSFNSFQPEVGQIRVGPLLIHGAGSSVFIHRDQDKGVSEIYALNRSVDVFFEGIKHSFVLPMGMKIRINDASLTDITRQLLYSKLKKEFRMQPIDRDDNSLYFDLILLGEERIDIWKDALLAFAELAPENLFFRSESPLDSLTRKIQHSLGFGIPQAIKDKRQFFVFMRDFVEAFMAFENRDYGSTQLSLEAFGQTLHNESWQFLLQRDDRMGFLWESFLKAHMFWVQTLFSLEPDNVWVRFWFGQQAENGLFLVKNTFFYAENLLAEGSLSKSHLEFEKILPMIEQIHLSPQDAFEVTKLRRLVVELFRKNDFFQTESLFLLYKFLVDKELILHTDQEFLDEIRLESSQDVLFFLQNFLEGSSRKDLSEILLSVYRKLNVSDIQERLGLDVFTDEEQAIINTILFVGNTGIEKEQLALIQQERDRQKELNSRLQGLQQQRDSSDQADDRLDHIANARELKDFLEDKGISFQSMVVKTYMSARYGLATQVNNVFFNDVPLDFEFFYELQFFDPLRIGNKEFFQVKPKHFQTFLKEAVFSEPITTSSSVGLADEVFIPQFTPDAVIQRKLLQERLASGGITVRRSDIRILDEEMQQFKVSNASFGTNMILSFEYNNKDDVVSDFSVKKSGQELYFASRRYSLDDFTDSLRSLSGSTRSGVRR